MNDEIMEMLEDKLPKWIPMCVRASQRTRKCLIVGCDAFSLDDSDDALLLGNAMQYAHKMGVSVILSSKTTQELMMEMPKESSSQFLIPF